MRRSPSSPGATSPATVRQLHDFVWWSGLTVAQARSGLAAIDRELTSETI
jgi:hypothetical protein